MPDLSDLVPFHSGQVLNIFSCPGTSIYKQSLCNSVFHFFLIIMNSQCHVVWKIVWILISSYLDLHCFQLSLYLVSDFYTVFNEFMHGISIVRAKLSSLCTICSLRQVIFSLDKYIIAIYLSLGK